MKQVQIELLLDNSGGKNIFEMYAQEIEQSTLDSGDLNNELALLMGKIQTIERNLQDLSENINASNEKEESIYSITIEKARNLLNVWIGLFRDRNKFPNTTNYLSTELDKLIEYTSTSNISQKSIDEIKKDFDTLFILDPNLLKDYTEGLNYRSAVESNDMEKISELNSLILQDMYRVLKERTRVPAMIIPLSLPSNQDVEDGEETLYKWDAFLWINTKDAVEANKFMNIISSTLGYIDDIKIEIIETGIGSFFQNWKIRIKGWVSKDDAKQILGKGTRALESYALDRHIEPIEKSKIDRKKTEEDIKRLMSEDQTKELNELIIQEKREDVKAKKLSNLRQQLEIRKFLSITLSNELMEIDSDFKIMINNLLLISQTNKKIEIGNINDIDEQGEKERIDSSAT